VKAVREQAAHGADWIKVYADYRTGPDGSAHATFSQQELDALVAAAHGSGRRVSAHAATDEGMRRAVLAGVDTIEHGYGGSEATFKLMAERKVAYFPLWRRPKRPASISRSICAARRRRLPCRRRPGRSSLHARQA
jgi:imidazolonepropionase-like amidohydrolase